MVKLDQEVIQLVQALEPHIQALAQKLWDKHPNNPKNKVAPAETVKTRMEHLVNVVLKEKLEAHYTEKFAHVPVPVLSIDYGKKYARIVRDNNTQRSVYFFVDLATGDVLKAAGWKAPAKGPRSNVYDADFGLSGIGPYGANYKINTGYDLGW